MRGNSVDLTHSSVLRPREHFESHCQWALFASKERQTMKLEMGKSHIRSPSHYSLQFFQHSCENEVFAYWWFSLKMTTESWFCTHLPQREASWVKALPLSEHSAAGEWHPFPHRNWKCLLPEGDALQRSSEVSAHLNSPVPGSSCALRPGEADHTSP